MRILDLGRSHLVFKERMDLDKNTYFFEEEAIWSTLILHFFCNY